MGDNQSRESSTEPEMERDVKKRESSPSKENTPVKRERKAVVREDIEPPFKSKVSLPANMEPLFYIGGGNGVALVEETLLTMGWRRTKDKADDNYRFRWTELKSQINYNKFREGEQLVNHIPNCNLLTNKLGLLNSLQEYERVCATTKKRAMKVDFLPETYRLDDMKDQEAFLETYQGGETWICKPTGRNQGKGIFLVRSPDEVTQMLQEKEDRKEDGKPVKPLNRIIQRYIHNPLLLDGKKFDIRCYMLVASTVPYLVMYHSGYVRLSMCDYDNDTDNLIAHLTNQFIQKKDPSYKDKKEDTAWSMDKFNDYVNENIAPEKGLEQDWVLTAFENRVKQILTHCFNAVKLKFQRKIGYFDLYGIDFMIDDDMKIWLIEMNTNPCLATNCEALKKAVPPVVKESIYVAIECFEKARRNRPILPLTSLKGFQVLVNDSGKTQGHVSSPLRGYQQEKRSYSASPVRRGASHSPLKQPSAGERDVTKTQSRSGAFAKNTTHATSLDPPQAARPGRQKLGSTPLQEIIEEDASKGRKHSKKDTPGTDKAAEKPIKDAKPKEANDAKDGSKSRPVVLTFSKVKSGQPKSRNLPVNKSVESPNTTSKSQADNHGKNEAKDTTKGAKTSKSREQDESKDTGIKIESKTRKRPQQKEEDEKNVTQEKQENMNTNNSSRASENPQDEKTDDSPLFESTSEGSASDYEVSPRPDESKPGLSEKDRNALRLNLRPTKDGRFKPTHRQKSPYLDESLSKPAMITLRMSHNHNKANKKRPHAPIPEAGELNRGS